MARFRHRSVDRTGRTINGELDAENEAEAARRLRLDGYEPIALKSAPAKAAPRGGRKRAAAFARNFALLLQAGHTAEGALAALSGHSGDRRGRMLAQALNAGLRAGLSPADAFAARPDLFPPHFAAAAEAGQATGALGQAIADLAADEERRQKLLDDIWGALAYPIFLALATLAALIFLMAFVVPRFKDMFADLGAATPPELALVFGVSDMLTQNGPALAIGAALAASGVVFALRLPGVRRFIDAAAFRMPLAGDLSRIALAARFFASLALFLRSGLSAAPALAAARRTVANSWARERLDAAFDRVRTGRSAAQEIAAAGILPPLSNDMLQAAEGAGALEQGARRLAALYEETLERRLKGLVRLAEPIFVAVAGVLIGAIMVSIVSALISVNETIAIGG